MTRTDPIRVLHIHGRMDRGGAEMRTLELLRHVDPTQYRLDCCAVSGRPGELDEPIRQLGGQVHLLRQGPVGFAGRFGRLLSEGRYDAVHSHVHYYSGYLLRLAAEAGVGVRVAHFHSCSQVPVTTPLRRAVRRSLSGLVPHFAPDRVLRGWVDRYATDILGVSRWTLSAAWKPDWQADPRCRVVYDGLSPETFLLDENSHDAKTSVRQEFGVPDGSPLFVHVGRMVAAKNHPRLMDIFAAVLSRQPDARLLLVGRTPAPDGPDFALWQAVRERIDALGLAERVIFAGQRPDVARLLRAADVMLFPSLWEGLGDAVIEAAAVGTPVVASALPSIDEIAQRLRGIDLLPLEAPDQQWAERAVERSRRRPTFEDRHIAVERFSETEFNIEQSGAALCRIWQGQMARSDAA